MSPFNPAEDIEISIHALREEGDELSSALLVTSALFLSTPSVRRATQARHGAGRQGRISIHALREEGDQRVINVTADQNNFYPRPP